MNNTPGPWKLDSTSSVYAEGGSVLVHVTPHGPFAPDKEKAEDNARLISAAPELLRVLKQLLDDPTDSDPNNIWSQAYEAVAQATGQPDTRIGSRQP